MSDPSSSDTPLRTTFKIKLNGDTLAIATVGQAYQFLSNFKSVEWMEFRSLHGDAVRDAGRRRRQRDARGAGDQRRARACS